MFRQLKRYQTPLVVFIALILPLLVYRANAIRPANANVLDKVILAATSPLSSLISGATGLVSDRWHKYVDVREARRENGELRRKLRVAERERDDLLTLAIQNGHLQALLEIKDYNPGMLFRTGEVIGAGSSPHSRTLLVNLGSLDGVIRGAPVIAGEGLVGLVQKVGWTSSELVLIADPKMSLRATVVRTRARGRITGRGLFPGFNLELSEVLRSDDIKPGDRVVTNGLGGIFPKGVPIGEITKVRSEPGVQHRLADVVPFVDFARIEHVAVVLMAPKEKEIVTPEPLRPPSLRSAVTSTTSTSTGSP